jgi:cytochrome c-type biogenesis protein CcmE
MSFWPKSRKARRRLTILLAIAPVLALAVGLAMYGLRDSISLFYTPPRPQEAHVAPGRKVQLGGLVQAGSVVKHPGGDVEFVVADQRATAKVAITATCPTCSAKARASWPRGPSIRAGPSSPSRCWPSTTSATCRATSPRR